MHLRPSSGLNFLGVASEKLAQANWVFAIGRHGRWSGTELYQGLVPYLIIMLHCTTYLYHSHAFCLCRNFHRTCSRPSVVEVCQRFGIADAPCIFLGGIFEEDADSCHTLGNIALLVAIACKIRNCFIALRSVWWNLPFTCKTQFDFCLLLALSNAAASAKVALKWNRRRRRFTASKGQFSVKSGSMPAFIFCLLKGVISLCRKKH